MRNTVKMNFAANYFLLMRNCSHALVLKIAGRFPDLSERSKYENKLGNLMLKQLLNPATAKYRDLSVSRGSIICLGLCLGQIIDLLDTNKYDILLNLVR